MKIGLLNVQILIFKNEVSWFPARALERFATGVAMFFPPCVSA